jgi:hypothetical protein
MPMSDAGMEEPLPGEAKVGTLMSDEGEWMEERGRPAPTAEITRAGPGRRGGDRHPSGFERTVSAIRTVVPFVQKVLPLLDGNVALAVANLLAPRLLAPPVDLHPVEQSVAKMRAELGELREGVTTHDAALKRIEEHVDTVKDSLERSVTKQQELGESLQRVQRRLTTLTVVGLFLLLASLGMNVVLLTRLFR